MSNNEKPNEMSSLPIHIQNLLGKLPFIGKNSIVEFLEENSYLTQSDPRLRRVFVHLGWDSQTSKFKQDSIFLISTEQFIHLVESEYNFNYTGIKNNHEKVNKGSITPTQVILNSINNFDSNFSPEGDRLKVIEYNLVPQLQ